MKDDNNQTNKYLENTNKKLLGRYELLVLSSTSTLDKNHCIARSNAEVILHHPIH